MMFEIRLWMKREINTEASSRCYRFKIKKIKIYCIKDLIRKEKNVICTIIGANLSWKSVTYLLNINALFSDKVSTLYL